MFSLEKRACVSAHYNECVRVCESVHICAVCVCSAGSIIYFTLWNIILSYTKLLYRNMEKKTALKWKGNDGFDPVWCFLFLSLFEIQLINNTCVTVVRTLLVAFTSMRSFAKFQPSHILNTGTHHRKQAPIDFKYLNLLSWGTLTESFVLH